MIVFEVTDVTYLSNVSEETEGIDVVLFWIIYSLLADGVPVPIV